MHTLPLEQEGRAVACKCSPTFLLLRERLPARPSPKPAARAQPWTRAHPSPKPVSPGHTCAAPPGGFATVGGRAIGRRPSSLWVWASFSALRGNPRELCLHGGSSQPRNCWTRGWWWQLLCFFVFDKTGRDCCLKQGSFPQATGRRALSTPGISRSLRRAGLAEEQPGPGLWHEPRWAMPAWLTAGWRAPGETLPIPNQCQESSSFRQ